MSATEPKCEVPLCNSGRPVIVKWMGHYVCERCWDLHCKACSSRSGGVRNLQKVFKNA